MADISVSRKPSGQFTWIWATLALLAVAGLMFWLSTQEGTTAIIAGADSTAVDSAAAPAGAEATDLASLAANPDGFAGRTVALNDVQVAATLGPRAFWADIPGQNPFLVVVEPEAGAPELASGQTLSLEGTVGPVDEAAVAQWAQEGALNEAAQGEASFATHVLLASQVSSQ